MALRFLQFLRHADADEALPPVLRDAPLDDEPVTGEERCALEEAYEAVAGGDVISDEELRRELGI